MIYVHSMNVGNIYTKLDDVLEIHKPNEQFQKEKEGYDALGKAVNQNYKNFSQKLLDLQIKQPLPQFKKSEYSKGFGLSTTTFHRTNRAAVSTGQMIVVTEKSKEDKFLNVFRNAIKNNSDEISNYEKCLEEFEKHFQMKSKSTGHHKTESKSKDEINNEDKEYIENISAKIELNKKAYAINTPNANAIEEIAAKEARKTLTKKIIDDIHVLRTARTTRSNWIKILHSAMKYLFFNNISIKEYQENNLFPPKQYHLKDSFDFLEAVKFNKTEVVEAMLKRNKALLFEYDYYHQTAYHWAAKRGYKQMLQILIDKGRHVNLYDLQKRTPLFFAAKNNQYECCELLLANGANPFFENREEKKPIDVAIDPVRKLLATKMDAFPELNTKSYFRDQILKKIKEEFMQKGAINK